MSQAKLPRYSTIIAVSEQQLLLGHLLGLLGLHALIDEEQLLASWVDVASGSEQLLLLLLVLLL